MGNVDREFERGKTTSVFLSKQKRMEERGRESWKVASCRIQGRQGLRMGFKAANCSQSKACVCKTRVSVSHYMNVFSSEAKYLVLIFYKIILKNIVWGLWSELISKFHIIFLCILDVLKKYFLIFNNSRNIFHICIYFI